VVSLCVKQGVSKPDATLVVETLFKYKPFFIDLMMTQELLLQKPRYSPVKNGV
jgi:hypothetical protein